MTRIVTVGAAQLGPIARSDTRRQVVERMLVLMRDAHRHGCDLLVFPELALTTFFPRWYFERQEDVDAFYDETLPQLGWEAEVLPGQLAKVMVEDALGC